MSLKVLVAVDKGEESYMALRYVCHLLSHFDAMVDAIHVKPSRVDFLSYDFEIPLVKAAKPQDVLEAEVKKVEERIIEACQICLEGKVPCQPRILEGDPAEEILLEAEKGDYDLLVLGSHGRSALKRFLLGCVHTKILNAAERPVLIVREYKEIHKVLLAYRGTQCDQNALRFVARIFARKKPEITIIHVQETELGETEEIAKACLLQGEERLKAEGHTPVAKLARGEFVDEVAREVMLGDYDLIVLGAYAHYQPKFLKMLSDEALALVNQTHRPVLVYRDKDDR